MKITIVYVGKIKEKFYKEAINEYIKRIGAYTKATLIEISQEKKFDGQIEKALQKEADAILKSCPKNSHVVLLDINAKQLSSTDLAAHFKHHAITGTQHITFIIGSSHGVDQAVQKAANESFSFGKITLAHNLALVVLLEQIYRVYTIINGHPYHK